MMIMILFVCAAAFMGAGFWAYNNQDETASKKALEEILELKNQVKGFESLVSSNISTVREGQLRIQEMKSDIIEIAATIEFLKGESTKMLRHQLQLKEDLSNKTSKIVFPRDGLSVNIIQTVPTKPAAPEFKKIKKQMEGLSK